jgi:hypothetical protein
MTHRAVKARAARGNLGAMATRRPRAARRQKARELEKLGRALDRTARSLPGGAPERPIRVDSAAVADAKVRAQRCPRCDGEGEVVDEAAEFQGGEQLRRFDVACRRCHAHRTIWIAVGARGN